MKSKGHEDMGRATAQAALNEVPSQNGAYKAEDEIDLAVLSNSQQNLSVGNRMHMCDNHDKTERVTHGGCKAIRSRNLLLACGGCRSVFYCNANCQKQDWARVHSKQCAALAEKRRRHLAKAKRQAEKLRKAKKEAEESNASFNASMTLMFMDDSTSSEETDFQAGDNDASLSFNEASLSRASDKECMRDSQSGLHSSQGSLDLNQLSLGGPSSSSRRTGKFH